LAGRREPHLRSHLPASAWAWAGASVGDEASLRSALAALRQQLAAAPVLDQGAAHG